MQFEESTDYTEELINEAALLYWKKTFASTFVISILGIVIALVFIYVLNLKTWVFGTFLGISVVSSVLFLSAFFIYKKRSLAVYIQMEKPTAKWLINEDHVSVESDAGKSEIKWKMFKEIIKSNKFWLLVYKNNSYSVLPITGVSNETLNFLNKKILECNEKNT